MEGLSFQRGLFEGVRELCPRGKWWVHLPAIFMLSIMTADGSSHVANRAEGVSRLNFACGSCHIRKQRAASFGKSGRKNYQPYLKG